MFSQRDSHSVAAAEILCVLLVRNGQGIAQGVLHVVRPGLVWQARREASAAANILSRFPPYKSLYSGSNPGAIVEEEDDFDENDEDPIADGGGSAASQRSTGGSTDFGSGRRRM